MSLSYRKTADAAAFEAEMARAAEQMSGDGISQVHDAWTSFPPDLKHEIQRRAALMWELRGAYFARFLVVLDRLFAQNPASWQQALLRDRGAAAQQLAQLAGQGAGLPRRGATPPRGMSDAQVREYRRRQQARGVVPGRNRQTGRYRELELELDSAARQLESAAPVFTKVTPVAPSREWRCPTCARLGRGAAGH